MIKFNLKYFLLTVLLLVVEIIIAAYFHDAIIRPYGGDFLVVILIYCFVRSFLMYKLKVIAIGVLLFAYVVEISQYFHFVYIIGLGNSKIARVIFGTYFCWMDMLMYTLGIILVLLCEMIPNKSALIKQEKS